MGKYWTEEEVFPKHLQQTMRLMLDISNAMKYTDHLRNNSTLNILLALTSPKESVLGKGKTALENLLGFKHKLIKQLNDNIQRERRQGCIRWLPCTSFGEGEKYC